MIILMYRMTKFMVEHTNMTEDFLEEIKDREILYVCR